MRDAPTNIDPWFVDLPPTSRQKWAAVAFAAVLLACLAVLAPFADMPLAQVNSFIPAFEAAVFVLDFMTAALLFAHFSVYLSRALQALACAYLFTALIVIPHALSFPGAFAPTGLFGAGVQTTGTLYFFWHYGFALGLLAYACLKTDTRPDARPPSFRGIVPSVALVVIVVCALVWLATAGEPLLPRIFSDRSKVTLLSHYIFIPNLAITALAFAVLLIRRLSILNLWVLVVILTLFLELVQVGLLVSGRFTVGFYAGRGFSLVTSAIVVTVLLTETSVLFGRVAWANAMLRRAQDDKLMSLEAVAAAIAHEVRQPLGAITMNGESALLYLGKKPINVEKMQSLVTSVVADGHRASQILQSILAIYQMDVKEKEPVVVNELVLGSLRSFNTAMTDNRITPQLELASELSPVLGHKGQLQEVVNNLVQNAIDALASTKNSQRVLAVRTQRQPDNAILLEVEDTGPGIDAATSSKIFDAFATTKSHGIGLGLAICQTIIERHGGKISVAAANPRGALFRVVLPSAPPPA